RKLRVDHGVPPHEASHDRRPRRDVRSAVREHWAERLRGEDARLGEGRPLRTRDVPHRQSVDGGGAPQTEVRDRTGDLYGVRGARRDAERSKRAYEPNDPNLARSGRLHMAPAYASH